jgi:hypothetical protein
MARIRKINVSQVEGNTDSVLPEGTIAVYEVNGEYVLRVHDGVTEGGVPFPNAPNIVHNDDINITVNSEDSSSYTWNFGQTGTLTAPGDIIVGGEGGGHFVIDATEGNNTSVRWYNIPVDENASLIRAYTGNPNDETELNRGRIQLAWQDSDRSGLRIISYDRSDEEDTVEHNWTFRGDGGLRFPDGTTQTTAYTGQTGGGGVIYIMANIDGNIVTSTDGVTWGDPTPSGIDSISRVAVHNGVIVYISGGGEGGPGQPGLYYSTTIGAVTLCVGTDTSDNNDIFWNQVRYFDEAQQWVAVGYIDGSTNNFPIVAHSTNGISWTLVPADNTFVSGINTTNADWELTDVAYMAETGEFVISSSLNGEGAYGGIFITNNITVPLDGTVHIAIDLNVDHTAPWSVVGLGGPPGYMILFSTSDEAWFGYGTDVLDYGSLDGEGPFSWAGIIADQIGYVPQITEIAYDADGFIAVTTGGHVITGSVSFEGPSFIVSIPLPLTTTTFSITNANPAVISFTEGSESANNNEKIEITLAGEYNGTYYVNTATGVLYTDQAMTTALNASTFASFTTGTVTFSHGIYFDAAGTSPSYYYIGNDEEQIFRSSNGITWTLLADVTGEYFNDFAYGTFGAGFTSILTNGEYTVALENNGTVTLPSGGTITEGVVTSNPTIQLTPATPDVASQKLVIKGGGLYSTTENGITVQTNNNVWSVSDSAQFYVYSDTYPNQTLYWWIYPAGADIADPGFGTVELTDGSGVFTFTVDSDDYEFTVRVSPEQDNYDPNSIGVESVLINGDAPTYGDHHLHLTTGDLTETSIFLGTDDHNVRTTTDGKIQITTPGEGNNVWEFGHDGDITLPQGGAIAEDVVTDNPTIELTPAMPDVESQKLVIKGGVFSEELDDYHLHLTTGDLTETSVILGTDEHNVRTVTTGGVQINTRDYELEASKTWRFSSTGELTLPPSDPDNFFSGQIYAGGDSGGFLNLDVQGMASEEDYGGVRLGNGNNKPVELWAGLNTIFRFDSDGSLTLPNGGSITAYFNGAPTAPVLDVRLDSPEEGGAQINLAVDNNSINVDNNGVGVGVGSNNWYFTSEGQLTFPDTSVQTTAYAGGVGRAMMIDTNRTDTYTEVGSADRPFKTFAAAIAAAEASEATAYTFILMGCTVTEDVDFGGTAFTQITISTTCRSVITGDVTINNNSDLSQLVIRNIEVGGTFTLTGDGTTNQMNNCSFYNASFSGAVNITATNATAFYEAAFFGAVNFTNLSYLYINGAQFNADWTITADSNGVIPSKGIDPGVAIVFGTIANNVIFVKGGTAAYNFQPHMTRLGRTTETYTVPAGWTMTPHSTVLRGTWVNNGTLALRNTSHDNPIGGSAPSYVGSIGAASLKFQDATTQTTAYAPVSSSWTLAPGVNTVSFTVDWNYTYTMWVRGNIPNGIAVWNATVTVTNSNVPVVGTQYGWYYVDGGALVLTAIPAQIVGTAGSISTAAPAVGTTSNTFVFSITNNTAESQIVYYGYTKI